MKKRAVSLIMALVLILSGCSSQNTNTPSVDTQTEAPTLPSSDEIRDDADETGGTIEALETGEEDGSFNPEIFIATDIHYLAKELTDFGPAFENMAENNDGQATMYVWEITDAFLDEVIARKPQALILLGDLSLEGERSSHEALAEKLGRVKAAGIQVLVIPGDHDINNSRAAVYKGDGTSPTVRTSPSDFAEIYAEFGYDDALSRDPYSLSYIAELKDGTRVLMIDSCQYDGEPEVGGMIRSETYDWMKQVLEDAWFDDKRVIAAAHHNIFDEFKICEEDCTIEHNEELIGICYDYDINLFLSGHLHMQHYKYLEEKQIDEIVTGALSISPCAYGVLKYYGGDRFDYHTEDVDVTTWSAQKNNPDPNLEEFEDYADEILQNIFYSSAMSALSRYPLSSDDKERMVELYAIVNIFAVSGRVYAIRDWALEQDAYGMWQDYLQTEALARALDEIIEDGIYDYTTLVRY